MTTELAMNLIRRQNLGDALRRAAFAVPDKPAVIFYTTEGASRTITYGQLNAQACSMAQTLLARGIRHGDRIVILSRNSIEFLIVSFALHKIGAWAVPVNFMLPPADVQHLIQFSEARWVFVEDAQAAKVSAIADAISWVEAFVQIGNGTPLPAGWLEFDALLSAPAEEPEIHIETDDVATLLFTSGTESAPKGVMLSHANYCAAHLSWSFNFHLAEQDRFLITIPLIHMAGYLFSTLCLANRATIVMTQTPQPAQMIELMARHRLTGTALPPTLYVALLSQPGFRTSDLTSLTKCLSWASTIPKAMVDGWRSVAPNLRFFSGQGMSESTAAILTGGFFGDWTDLPNGDGRWVGRACSFGVDVRLVDDEDRDVPVGEPGEQIVRGPIIMKGYYKNEEANRRAFRGGWFHTGDVLIRDAEGNYFFADRVKDMIKTGGENVYSQEVENVLGTHPEVMQCAVFAVSDPHWGEAVAAAVLVRPGSNPAEAELIAYCRERLAGFKTPKYIFFRETMPVSAANKLLKRELKAEYGKKMAG